MPDLKKCPFCAEEIKAEAIKCKHCGEMLDITQIEKAQQTLNLSAQNKPLSPTNTKIILLLLGLCVFIYGIFYYSKYAQMDTSVEVPPVKVGEHEYIPSTRVNNIGLMNEKTNGINSGLTFLIIGIIFFVFGAITPGETAMQQPNKENLYDDTEIYFYCEFCKTRLSTQKKNVGQTFPCPNCGQNVTITRYPKKVTELLEI